MKINGLAWPDPNSGRSVIKAEIILVDGSCLIIREYIGSKYGIMLNRISESLEDIRGEERGERKRLL